MKIEHNHEHHEKATGNLLFVFILNITFNVIVILGGLITNSVAILADCLHDLSDTISIGLAGCWSMYLRKIQMKIILMVIKGFLF